MANIVETSRFADRAFRDERFDIEIIGERIPLKFRRGGKHAKGVIFIFHGAIGNNRRKIPHFAPFLPGLDTQCHQISISDPTTAKFPGFPAAWYAGHSGFYLQRVLPDILQKITSALGASKTIYVGGSSGGFAALYYSWHHPGSATVAAGPQTNLRVHNQRPITTYRTSCWPEMGQNEELLNVICSDVGQLYGQKFDNLVVYIQSSGDRAHIFTHLTNFLSHISGSRPDRFILHADFWGRLRHGNAVPGISILPWVRAYLRSPSLLADDLLIAKDAIDHSTAPLANIVGGRTEDIGLTNALRDWELYGRPPTGDAR